MVIYIIIIIHYCSLFYNLAVTMDAGKAVGQCAFEMLFTRNVPHILEKIFFSLDYESFQTCFKVNSTWNELLSSESYKKITTKMLIEKEKNEKNLWEMSGLGKTSEVKKLVSAGGWMNMNCGSGWDQSTPLHQAAKHAVLGSHLVPSKGRGNRSETGHLDANLEGKGTQNYA